MGRLPFVLELHYGSIDGPIGTIVSTFEESSPVRFTFWRFNFHSKLALFCDFLNAFNGYIYLLCAIIFFNGESTFCKPEPI